MKIFLCEELRALHHNKRNWFPSYLDHYSNSNIREINLYNVTNVCKIHPTKWQVIVKKKDGSIVFFALTFPACCHLSRCRRCRHVGAKKYLWLYLVAHHCNGWRILDAQKIDVGKWGRHVCWLFFHSQVNRLSQINYLKIIVLAN